MDDYEYLVAKIVPLVLDALLANSTAAGEIETVASLDNIKALAAYRRVGGTEKTVEVPLDILTRPIDDIVALCQQAADSVVDAIAQTNDATAEAIAAAGSANVAAQAANDAVVTILALKGDTLAAAQEARDAADEAKDQTALALAATEESKTATEAAQTATANANDAETNRATAETGRVDAENARETAESGRADAEGDRVAAETARDDAEQARAIAETGREDAESARVTAEDKRASDTTERLDAAGDAIDRLNDLSDHPPKMVNGYWQVWDEATQAYIEQGASGFVIIAFFATLDDLRAAVPAPHPGDAYGVGSEAPYDIYVFDGQREDWVDNGQLQGAPGASAYELWLADGNEGTVADFLDSLKGAAGKSAYEVAVANGYAGTVEEWLASLEGKDGDPGASGRDFEVPTLDAAPTENTLTYEVGDKDVAFRIGQQARFFDTERGDAGEYVFYQLYDLSGDKAVWKLAGSGGGGDFELPGETLVITLKTNQPNTDANLLGAIIRLTHPGEERDLVWQGQPITVEIPFGVDYVVAPQDISQFATPDPQAFVSNVGYNRSLTLTYLAESVVITASTFGGNADATTATITVTDDDASEVRYSGAVGTGVQLYFPFGTKYSVVFGEISGYITPAKMVFTARIVTRPISVVYILYTHLVFDQSVADPANIEGAGTGPIIDIIAKMRRCMCKKTADGEVAISYLDNANSNLYADGTASVLTGNDGDVMVYKSEFFYKYEAIDETHFAINIAEQAGDESWIHSPASLIGAYKSNTVSSKLYSRSGVAPSGSISQANNIIYAKARGAGYNIIDFEQHCMIALLFYAKYGNRNSQAVLGAGNQNYTSANGTTNAIGNADTVAATSGHASFAGIEGVHGGAYEWVAGAAINNGLWTITNPDGTTRSGNTTAWTAVGWVMEIAAALGPYFDLIPTTVGGSATTYYSDYYDYNPGLRVLARSFNGTSTYGGVSYTLAHYDSSYTFTNIASRLAFRGVIREAESVSAFKALPVL